MAVTVDRQPPTGYPIGISENLKFYLDAGGANLGSFGGLAYFNVSFNAGGGANGQTITLANMTFTTDDSTPFTAVTWNYAGTAEQSALNFADMIRANYYFEAFSVDVVETSPGVWEVRVQAFDFGLRSNWTFDYTGLAPAVFANDEYEGEDTVLNDFQIWYRVWNENTPIGDVQRARVPFSTSFGSEAAEIDISEEVRSVLINEPPPFNTSGLVVWSDPFSGTFSIRFGGILLDATCTPSYITGGESDPIEVVASVHQLENYNRFLRFTPGGAPIGEVPFTTSRPDRLTACPGSFEWLPIWIAEESGFSFPFRAVWEFYNADDSLASTIYRDIDNAGFNNLGIGHGLLGPFLPSGATYYKVYVEGTRSAAWEKYSVVARRDIASCDCNAAEVYYLEDAGGWGTVIFHRLEEREIQQTDLRYETKLDTDTGELFQKDLKQYYIDGGRYSVPSFADRVFTFTTERIPENKRSIYEQIVRSPEFYIRTAVDTGGQAMRRIIPDRANVTTWRDGEAIRISIPFRFNSSLNIHKW